MIISQGKTDVNITAVVQARLGSKRLPMKALLSLNGLAMIDQVFKQLQGSTLITKIALSTSDSELDRMLVSHCAKSNRQSTLGPADDIIGRLHQAAVQFHSDVVVRVWGDCPFVCPDVIDQMLTVFVQKKLDFMANSEPGHRTYPLGLDVEIYSKTLLDQLNTSVKDPKLREFPAVHVRRELSSDRQQVFHTEKSQAANICLTVDYPEDLAAADSINRRLSPQNQVFNFTELYNLIQKEPALFAFSEKERNIEFRNFLNAKPQIELLEGPDIYFAPLTESDLTETLPRWIDDQEVTRFLSRGSVPADPARLLREHQQLIKDGNDIELGLYDKKSNKLIGVAGIHSVNRLSKHGEFRILIGEKTYWGRGLGTQACRMLSSFVFEKMEFNKVWLGVNSENAKAYKSYLKSGFVKEGVLRQELLRNGRYYDIVRMSLLKSEYENIKSEWDLLQWIKK